MYIREAVLADIARLAQITINGLPDGNQFNYQWPNFHQFPDDGLCGWTQILTKWLYESAISFRVIQLEPTEEEPGLPHTVVAYAIWERKGDGAKNWAIKKNNAPNQELGILLASTQQELFKVDGFCRRDGSQKRQNALDMVGEEVQKYLNGRYSDRMELVLMVTDKPFRRQGHARQLIEEGIEWADEERVHIAVEATDLGQLVYKSLGFNTLNGRQVQVEGEQEKLTFVVMERVPKEEESS